MTCRTALPIRPTVSSEGHPRGNGDGPLTTSRSLPTKGADVSMPISKRTRYEVLRRDNHTCRYCGGAAPDVVLTVDHVTPVALGGTDDPSNLVAACRDCNAGKSSTVPGAPLVEDVKQDALRWARAIEQAAAVMAADTKGRFELNDELNQLWVEMCVGWSNVPWDRPADWPETLDTFRSHGLPQAEILDAFWVMYGKTGMMPSNRWRYFCGICWRKIDRLQEAAKALLEAEGADDAP